MMRRIGASALATLATLALSLPYAAADDTEIFFGRSDDAFESNPNILFVLDNSGSMSRSDSDAEGSRMERLKAAMRLLLDQSSSYNVGLAAFQGEYGGGAIRYPVGYLESDSSELCENGTCPDETIVVRPAGSDDDGAQDDISNVVTLDAPTLVMVDADAGVVDVVENTLSGSSVATSHAHEAWAADGSGTGALWLNRSTPEWFFESSAYEKTRVAYRFEDVRIPADATVTAASITFSRTALSDQVGNVSARIAAEATATPTPYTTDTSDPAFLTLTDRNDEQARTNANIPWDDIAPNALDAADTTVEVVTPDLSDLLTEIAGLNGWASGNAMSVLVTPADDYTASAADVRRFHGSDATGALRPVLNYTYTQASDPDTGSLDRLASAHLDEYTEQNTGAAWSNTGASVTRLSHVGPTFAPRSLALRFDDLAIPRGATIRTARLTMHAAAGTATEADATDWTRDPNADPIVGPGPDPVVTADPVVPDDQVVLGEALGDGVSLTIKAEQSGSPAPFGLLPLSARTLGSTLQPWSDLPDMPGTALESPDFVDVIAELTNLEDWDAGDDLVLVLSPDANYRDAADNVRRFLTSTGGVKPRLEVTWDENDSAGPAVATTQTTAIRFPRVHVPPGAEITSARLVFTAAAADDTPTVLTVSAQTNGAPAPLSTTLNDIGARDKSSARVTWTVDPWDIVGQEYASDNLQPVIEEIVGLSDWCGGNPMTLFVSAGYGKRVAEAYTSPTSRPPKLEITYSPSSVVGDEYCSNTSLDVSMSGGADDAVQVVGGGAQRNDELDVGTHANLDGTGAEQDIGLRFDNVRVPKDARIVSAALRLTTRTASVADAEFRIRVEDTDDAAAFRATADTIDERSWDGDETWTDRAPVGAGEPVVSADITDLLERSVSRDGWASGNAIAFRLEHRGGAARHFMSFDSDETNGPDLIVYYESVRSDPGTLFRDNLIREVDALRTGGWTPIVSSLYESVRYLRGEPVDYGAHRGEQRDEAKYYRLSHPYSYTGGTISRDDKCDAFDPDDKKCIDETIDGNPIYTSPMESQCQSNHIVLLSDGAATRDDRVQARISALIGGSCDTSGVSADEACGVELAAWAAGTDHAPAVDGNQTINLHTIALSLADNPDASDFLESLATAGKGGFYPANSSEQLLDAFKNIFINVSKTDASFVSPSVTVSATNRLKHRDDMYFSLFKPEPTARWGGNLKRYRATATAGNTADIVDVDGDIAIDAATGEFRPGARSWWSNVTDGGSVLLGGAAEQLGENDADNANRKVATFTGLADGGNVRLLDDANELDAGNNRIDTALYDVPPLWLARDGYLEDLIGWTRGRDVLDHDGDQDLDETRSQMGDPMHSQPELVTYADGRSVVFVATNEGFLHAIDTATGEERWAFIPKELLKNQHEFFQNAATRRRPYGLDGGLTTWLEDDDRDGVIDSDENAWLYVGMRRGGDSYYALDISDLDDPKFAWQITGGFEVVDTDPTTADGNFEELGQTWSKPVKTRILDGGDGDERDVLVFAGGYDANQDPPSSSDPIDPTVTTRTIDGIGKTIYVVDARTGEMLWQPSTNDPAFVEMKYSIPSELRVIDIDFDGLVDMIFVADMGGQVWRLDFDNDQSVDRALSARVSGGRIALLASDDPGHDRRFYYPPDVSLISVGGRQQLSISLGSGWRAHPLANHTQDRFYSIRSTYVYGPPVDSSGAIAYPTVYDDASGTPTTGFADVTTDVAPLAADVAKGWYIDLGNDANGDLTDPGEKVLATSVTANNQLVFTTYLPESDVGACAAAAGSSAVYAVNVLNGAPTGIFTTDPSLDVNDRKRRLNQSGLAGDVAVLFPEGGEATVMIGTEKLDEVDIGDLRRRTFWQEMLE